MANSLPKISADRGRTPDGTTGQKSSIMIIPNTYTPFEILLSFPKTLLSRSPVFLAMIWSL